MSFLRFHVNPKRREVINNAACPVFHDKTLNAHIVMDPDLGAQLLSASTMEVAPFGEGVSRLTAATGNHFPHISYALKYVPLAHNGARHRELRRQHAQLIRDNTQGLEERLPELVREHLAKLQDARRLELMTDIVHPLVNEFLKLLTGAGTMPSNISGLFDSMLGVKKRKKIDASIGAVRRQLKDHLPPHEEATHGVHLSLAILGNDALRGTIGTSIGYLLQQFPDRKMSEIDWPTVPPETGVPYIERHATAQTTVGGIEIEAGQRFRMLMQAFAYLGQDEAERLRIFGVGAHTCLGRPIALSLWRTITAELARIDRYARIRRYALRADDFVFTVPETIEVELSD